MVKQEPEAYSWEEFLQEGRTAWTGIRNFQARNHLRAMKKGDLVLFYHSVSEKRLAGLARVIREAYPDPTAKEGAWLAVDLEPVTTLKKPVTLEQMKKEKKLGALPLFKQPRLSVLPLEEDEFNHLLQLSETFPRRKMG